MRVAPGRAALMAGGDEKVHGQRMVFDPLNKN